MTADPMILRARNRTLDPTAHRAARTIALAIAVLTVAALFGRAVNDAGSGIAHAAEPPAKTAPAKTAPAKTVPAKTVPAKTVPASESASADASRSLDDWRSLILPDMAQEAWAEIPWRAAFWEAVVEANRRRKPVLFWAMNGHPLGCT